jgi:hypothetical protein
VSGLLGMQGLNHEALFARLESMQEVIKEVNQQFSDAVRPTQPPIHTQTHRERDIHTHTHA